MAPDYEILPTHKGIPCIYLWITGAGLHLMILKDFAKLHNSMTLSSQWN